MIDQIQEHILILRGHKVMLSTHLATLYRVKPKVLLQAVKRNLERFPADFMFQLTWQEQERLPVIHQNCNSPSSRSQIVTLKKGLNIKYLTYAFTEQGVAMLSSVLRNPLAIQVNIEIMRTFVQLRHMLAGNAELSKKLGELEKKYDTQFKAVFDAIRQLMTPPPSLTKRKIGFMA